MEDLHTAAATTPLDIAVTEAGEEALTLRALLRQAAPMLRQPHDFSDAERLRLSRKIDAALDGTGRCPEALPAPDDGDAPPEEVLHEGEYAPGRGFEPGEDWP